MRRFFITGTDTDCGKTYVAGQLASYLPHALVIKPVASGCIEQEGQWINADSLYLQQYSRLPLDTISPWCFKLAASPHIAAKAEGRCLSIEQLTEYCINFTLPGIEYLFIEGAGGLIVPLNEKETWVDFLKLSNIPVILVVGIKLGCINHALLTAAALQNNQLGCVGWIANYLEKPTVISTESVHTLQQRLPFPLLASVPYEGTLMDWKEELLHAGNI